MAPKKRKSAPQKSSMSGYIKGAGEVVSQAIVDTLEGNYMPYAMSVIMSRAIPEIDGFKPSHRKLLYTMYKMGLLTGARQKSSKIAGSTMALNPHGDAAIYDTMVRMTVAYEALLHPYVDSKGSFGKAYSRDTQAAASRYTEAKLAAISAELFRDIDSDAVDMVDNFDNTMKEPSLLPVTFPAILCNSNTGIAVGMASSICSFNLNELIETTIQLLKNPKHDISSTLLAPDFPGGGQIIYNKDELEKVYHTGRGSIKVRARYTYDREANCIDITQIPPTTTCEQIIEKVIDLVKNSKIKEISDIRDEQGLHGLRITIDLKRGADPDKLMQKLYKLTTLEDGFACNFNVLIDGSPRVLGVDGLLDEWIKFRMNCVQRRTAFTLGKKKEKLHLLEGLQKILLDIDKAIRIIRETEEEADVVPNLMKGFDIDEVQAEYVAEIKLRHINREYILKRTEDIENLRSEIADLEEVLSSPQRVKKIIISELKDVAKKYGQPRRSMILYSVEEADDDEISSVPDYPVNIFVTQEGYIKKISPQSLRMSSDQKLKEGDRIIQTFETRNVAELLFFTDKCQVYKSKAADFSDTKASVLGEYVPAVLGMDEDEHVKYCLLTTDYSGYVLFAYENGKVAKAELNAYATKTNRRKLLAAYSDKSPLVNVLHIVNDCDILIRTTNDKVLIFNSDAVPAKTRSAQGNQIITLRRNAKLSEMVIYAEGMVKNESKFRPKNLPAAGSADDSQQGKQMTLM